MPKDNISTPPALHIAAETPPAELAAQKAAQQLQFVGDALRELTANLLRVARGAGRPHSIMSQITAYLQAAVDYNEATGRWPDEASLLSWRPESRHPDSDIAAVDDAQQQIISGALQIVASRLLGQNTQNSAGDTEFFDGFYKLEAARAENRKKSERTKNLSVQQALANVERRIRSSRSKKPRNAL